ncbi:MAG: YihY/virulence factor BrkB family protein [Clostridia bacterium]|nr:YihY/virulence factor BrkB family protein [Clostridia bacterium]
MSEKKAALPALFRIMKELGLRFFQDRVSSASAELSYYLLFALFPALIFLNSAISMLHLSASTLEASLGIVLPEQATDVITAYLSYIKGLDTRVLFYACLVLTVYAVSRAVVSLMSSVSKAYRVPRGSLFTLLAGVIFTVALLVVVFLLLMLIMVSKNLLVTLGLYLHIPDGLIRIWGFLRLAVGPILMCLLLTGFYSIVAFRHYRFWQALPGAGFAVVCWFLLTSGFSYYIGHISHSSLLYGSLTSIMVLMLWFHLTATIIIMGSELNHILAQLHAEKRALKGASK